MKYVLAGVLCVLIFVMGFFLGRFTATTPIGTGSFSNNNDGAQAETSGEGTTVNASQMSPGQRQMLQAMGIDPDSITITPEMVACAEAKVGASRVEEIKNGATPTMGEAASLLVCYQSS